VLVLVELVAFEREEGAGADAGGVSGVCTQKLVQHHHLDVKNLQCEQRHYVKPVGRIVVGNRMRTSFD
jgi:hypothetical protein